MARRRLTAHKSTGGRVPRHQLAERVSRRHSTFLSEYGMPTLLWRTLFALGYPEGKEPRYFWDREPAPDGEGIWVTAVVKPRGDDPAWGGWHFGSSGRTPKEGAGKAAYLILRDLMDNFPEELAIAMPGIFPRDDPSNSKWEQPEGSALAGGASEQQHSDTAAMSAMFAVMQLYDRSERNLGMVTSSLAVAKDELLQAREAHTAELVGMQAELAQMTLVKSVAIQERDVVMLDNTLWAGECQDYQTMLVEIIRERNAAWSEIDQLRATQVNLMQQLNNAEAWNANLHEEIHQLHAQLNPVDPPAPEEEEEAAADDGGEVSEVDSDQE
jgi:hypothetical protein